MESKQLYSPYQYASNTPSTMPGISKELEIQNIQRKIPTMVMHLTLQIQPFFMMNKHNLSDHIPFIHTLPMSCQPHLEYVGNFISQKIIF